MKNLFNRLQSLFTGKAEEPVVLEGELVDEELTPTEITTYVVLYRGDNSGRVHALTTDNGITAGNILKDMEDEGICTVVGAFAVHHPA